MKMTAMILASVLVMAMASRPSLPVPEAKPEPPTCSPCDISTEGLALIKHFEGFSPYVYIDAAGHPTIGFGHLIKDGETFKEPLLGQAAHDLLLADALFAVNAVNQRVEPRLFQGQFDALASFTFNLGGGAFGKSTLLKRVNAERHADVPEQFMRWVYAGGKKLRGLERRRKAEAVMYEMASDL